jgi:AcrR family transcriptional regulator
VRRTPVHSGGKAGFCIQFFGLRKFLKLLQRNRRYFNLTETAFWSKLVQMRHIVQTEEVRNAILDATDNLLARRGYKKMTIDELAQEVGIGKGSIYLHFRSKEEIVLSHIDRIVERLRARLRQIADENGTAETRLKEMLLTRVLFRFDSVQHYTISLNDLLSAVRPHLLLRRKQYFLDEACIFARVIGEGQKSGEFAAADIETISRALLTATNSLLPYSLSTRELGERHEIEMRTADVANLILKGLRAGRKS